MERLRKNSGAIAEGRVSKGPDGYRAAISFENTAVSLTEGPMTFARIIEARGWIIDTAANYGFESGDFEIREDLSGA